jgi:hypothetical protein
MKVTANIGKNRLYITISGKISKDEMDKLYTNVRFSVADLQPGFGVISDFTECSLAHLAGVSTFKKIMSYLIRNGVGEVVRLINGDSLLFKQFINLSSKMSGYIPIYVSNREEAEKRLDKPIRRNGLRFRYNKLPPVQFYFNDVKGKGKILNISISGCKVGSASLCPPADEETLLFVRFNTQDTCQNEFRIKARVVRIDEDGFAVEFTDLSDDQRDQLWQCLLAEFENDSY